MEEITGYTYQTSDYDRFTRLEGNRPVLDKRVTKIKTSINKHGYIFNPIVVNEKFQIIDGQGRYEALKQLGLPIDYVVANGAGLEQCIALNASGTIWTMPDYINTYCELGNENYIRLRDLMDEFPELKTNVKLMLITGLTSVPTETVKNGNLIIPESLAKSARTDLFFARKFSKTLERVKGTPAQYFYAIVFASHCGADKDRLESVIERSDLPPAPNNRIALDTISDIYNRNLKISANRIYLYSLYEETMTKKYGWYGAKWGNKEKQEEQA